VVGKDFHHVGVFVGREGFEHRLCDFRDIVRGIEWEVQLRQREAVDVAVQERVGMGGHRDVEAAGPKGADDRVVMSQVSGAGPSPGFHKPDRPPVA